jgi:hypothetical protein
LEQVDALGPEKQLMVSMGMDLGKLLTANGQEYSKQHNTFDGGEANVIGDLQEKGKKSVCVDASTQATGEKSTASLHLTGECSMSQQRGALEGFSISISCMTPEVLQACQTPEVIKVPNSDYQIVGEQILSTNQ